MPKDFSPNQLRIFVLLSGKTINEHSQYRRDTTTQKKKYREDSPQIDFVCLPFNHYLHIFEELAKPMKTWVNLNEQVPFPSFQS